MDTDIQRENGSNLLNVLLKNISDGIFIADRNFNTIAYSETYRKFLGASQEEMQHKKITDFYNEGWLSCIPIVEIIERKVPNSQLIKYRKTEKEILCTGVPVLENGEIEYAILSFRDLTRLKALENELRSSRNLLDEYKEQLTLAQSEYASILGENTNGIVYRSDKMRLLLQQVVHIAQYASNVLITGKTGTGKGLFAKLIHESSKRSATGKFVKVDCANIPENLLESELFGYSRGSFTGASNQGKTGLVEMANGGTLFLDEIGEMPVQLQSKLLNMVEDKKIKRIGEAEYRDIDIRIISATNRDLEREIKSGSFRSDLYYRLNVLQFEIPPLADRQEDIVPLINYYLKQFSDKHGIKIELSLKTYLEMIKYNWPGNVRELIHTTERIMLLGEDVALRDLCAGESPKEAAQGNDHFRYLKSFMADIEKEYLSKTLRSSRSIRDCADMLGIDVSTLVRKMKRYKLSKQTNYGIDSC